MKGDKWRKTRRQPHPTAGQNGEHEGKQMKGDKAAAAAKSRPEWRSCRETSEGRQGGSGSQEHMKGDKWREMKGDKAIASRPFSDFGDRQPSHLGNEGRQGGSGSQERQPRADQNGDMEGRQMKGDKGDKAAAASGPFRDCGDQQPNLWEVKTPIASSYLGKKTENQIN